MKIWEIVAYLGLSNLLVAPSVLGQIIPDRTIGTTVTPNLTINGILSDRIDHGTIRGSNLFHSFQEFNIGSGQGAYFSNPAGITNIFSRITGNNSSQINGTLGVLGNANLYLLNPNGILFGQNARLDLKGSFLATTANQINFADGTVFSATNPQTSALLTISVPVGLQFGSNTGPITVLGAGNGGVNLENNFGALSGALNLQGTPNDTRLNNNISIPSPLNINIGSNGLQVQPQKTLALVGGNLTLNGGLLSAPGGQIELGSVTGGIVALNPSIQGWVMNYGNVSSFGNIQITQKALASVVGSSAGLNIGSVQIQGQQVNIENGSLVLVQNQSSQTGGDININATNSLHIIGQSTDFNSSTGLVNETVSSGAAGNIRINTPQLTIEGALFINRTFSSGKGGDIILNIGDELRVDANAPSDPQQVHSSLFTNNYAEGDAGNIFISAPSIFILNGSNMGSVSFSQGNAGNITISANTIQLKGSETVQGIAGYTNVISLGAGSGNSGNEIIDTNILSLQNGASLSATSISTGNSGTIKINASKSVEVSGIKDGQAILSSAISTGVYNLFGQNPISNSGNITINTPILNVLDGANIVVQNQGAGNGGSLSINAGTIRLDHNGKLVGSTASGEGGNINLEVQDLLQISHGSFISTEAGGSGNGGNVNIKAPVFAGLENSDIIANAIKGRGGNIEIVTEGIFLSPDSNITASSQLGISGTVSISNPNLQKQNAAITSTPSFSSQEQVLASNCLTRRNSQQGTFVITGNGGLPETPDSRLLPYDVLQSRSVNVGRLIRNKEPQQAIAHTWHFGDSIQEATGFTFTPDGKVILFANANHVSNPDSLICFQ